MRGCKAYERGDQWFCDDCGLVWDINDDDPPPCQQQDKPATCDRELASKTLDKLVIEQRRLINRTTT